MDLATQRVPTARLPWRQLGVLALIALLIAAALAVYVGSRPRLPAPFGPAANGGIAYSSSGDIVVGDPSSEEGRRLTTGPDLDTAPLYSPDGRKIAFLRATAAQDYDLMVIEHDGGEPIPVTTGSIAATDFVEWAPDSRWLLVGTAANEVFRVDAVRGGDPILLATDAILASSTSAFRPPDGRQILFHRESVGGLWVMDSDGANVHLVIDNPEPENRDFGYARWSPDGSMIAFPGTVGDGEQYRIFIVGADGSGLRRLSTEAGIRVETDLRWSPDGTQISFNHWLKAPNTDRWDVQPIGILSVDSGEMTVVGPVGNSAGTLQEWSPDGRSLLALPAPLAERGGSATGFASIIDVQTGEATNLPWGVETPASWQRLAPPD